MISVKQKAERVKERFENNQALLMTKQGQYEIAAALLEALELIEFYGDGSKYSPLRNVGIDQGKKARDFLASMNKTGVDDDQ